MIDPTSYDAWVTTDREGERTQEAFEQYVATHRCVRCGEQKAPEDFYTRKGGLLSSDCRACHTVIAREYRARKRSGAFAPKTSGPRSPAPMDYFRRYAEQGVGCWRWHGTVTSNGYGRALIAGLQVQAHRLAYELFVGPIPAGLYVCHRCDNPICVNPNHLFIGTPKENMADKITKGRANVPTGERHPRARLTTPHVQIIDYLLTTGLGHRHIARAMAIPQAIVRGIALGETWRHVTGLGSR